MVGKDETQPVICREGTDGKYMYNCTLSLTFALEGDEWSTPRPDRFIRGNVPVPAVERAGWAPVRLMVGWLMYDELEKTWKRRGGGSLFKLLPQHLPWGTEKIMKIHMPWVFYTRPSGLYHAARGHIYKLCMYYKNDTII